MLLPSAPGSALVDSFIKQQTSDLDWIALRSRHANRFKDLADLTNDANSNGDISTKLFSISHYGSVRALRVFYEVHHGTRTSQREEIKG